MQAELADLSVQTCVISSEGCNQVVVYGSCGLVDANPSRPEFFVRAPALVSFAKAAAFALDCLLWSYVFMPAPLTPELGPSSVVSFLWFSKGALGESVLGRVINWLGVSLWS